MQSPFGSDIQFSFIDSSDSAKPLLPEEAACLTAAPSPKRLKEFALGRTAAHHALSKLGVAEPAPLLQGWQREPLWPPGFVGSITHSQQAAAAAVAPAALYAAIGIDLEALPRPGVERLAVRFAREHEIAWIKETPAGQDLRALLLFSAKESVFKAFFPLCRKWFGFHAVSLRWNSEQQRFDGWLERSLCTELPAGLAIAVQAVNSGDMVLTGLALTSAALAHK